MPESWAPTEIEFVRANWKSLPKSEIAKTLGKSLYAVTAYAYRHGWSRHSPSATYETLTEAEKAYIAGIIDGEGHIEIRLGDDGKGSRHYTISIVIANTDYSLLYWLQRRLVGSYIQPRIRRPSRPHWKPCWVLRLHRRGSVRSLLTECLPYLIVKKERALAALQEIGSMRGPRQWR